MNDAQKPPFRELVIASIGVILLAVLLCGCAPRIEPGPGELRPEVATWGISEWLAGIAGLAAIGCFVVFAFLREYAAAATASLGCVGLAACFLVLPTIVAATKWAFIASLVLAVGGIGYLALSRVHNPDAPLPKFLSRLKRGKTNVAPSKPGL